VHPRTVLAIGLTARRKKAKAVMRMPVSKVQAISKTHSPVEATRAAMGTPRVSFSTPNPAGRTFPKTRRGSDAPGVKKQAGPAAVAGRGTEAFLSREEMQQDPAFFEGLVNQCDQRVYRLALRITRNHQDAEEARQETMLKAYRHLEQFEGRARFTTWISRIAINEALMKLRKRRDSIHVPLEAVSERTGQDTSCPRLFPTPESPEMAFSRGQLRNSLMEAIGSLSSIHREVFILRTVEQCSTSETAQTLQLTESAVKTRLRRARMQLRQTLQARWEAEAS
jgi:RNA polymerase sigma-70 factor (ECF subfamily)